jgi:hypothetical protein
MTIHLREKTDELIFITWNEGENRKKLTGNRLARFFVERIERLVERLCYLLM